VIDSPTDPLEAAYRRLLRLFPPSYRVEREEEMLAVLLECADPGRATTTWADRRDLGRAALVAWTKSTLGPDAGARRDAAAVLSVVLPLLMLFPAGRIALGAIEAKRHHVLRDFLRYAAWDSPAWLIWTVVAGLVLVGLGRWARWPAIAGLALYVAFLSHQLAAHNRATFAGYTGWLLAQSVAAILLWSPTRVARGTELVRAPWRWVMAAGVALLSLAAFQGVFFAGGGFYLGPRGNAEVWRAAAGLVLLVALVVAVRSLRTGTGRVVVPAIAACVAFGVAARAWAVQVSWGGWSLDSVTDLHLLSVGGVVLAPLVVFALLRVVFEALARPGVHETPRPTAVADLEAAPDQAG